MGLQTEVLSLTVDALPAFAADRKREGWRFVQLMQGSMVSTIMLTSARSQPASAVVMPARFCEVGVGMRKGARDFDPVPRA